MSYNQLQFEGCFKTTFFYLMPVHNFLAARFIFTHSIFFKNLVRPACKERNLTTSFYKSSALI